MYATPTWACNLLALSSWRGKDEDEEEKAVLTTDNGARMFNPLVQVSVDYRVHYYDWIPGIFFFFLNQSMLSFQFKIYNIK